MAALYPYDTSADALLHPAKNAAFFAAWSPADTANHDLLCAELSRLAYAEEPVARAALAGIGFEAIGFLGGESEAARRVNRGTQGFVARHAGLGLTVLAFRGTESDKFEDLVSDLSTLPVPHPAGGRVHRGFWQAYLPVKERIAALLTPLAADSLLITGHSLGAALATLAAVDFPPAALVTFGSPRVGDATFAAAFAPRPGRPPLAIRRHVGCCDVVTRVPPASFDAAHLATLLGELADGAQFAPSLRPAAHFAIGVAARSLALPFAAVSPPPEFTHVGPARYVDADGLVRESPDDATLSADQSAARRTYPHSVQNSLDELTALFRSLAEPGRPRTPRDFLRALFGLVHRDRIPLRDLADHAPLNYLSALSGRRPSPH